MQLTSRRQSVTVFTVNALRSHLERISSAACRFAIHKVHSDRVSVSADYVLSDKDQRSLVVFPAYPTGWLDDAVCNNLNVVLDPLQFDNAADHFEREIFEPLLGHEVLHHFENMHPAPGEPVSRCC
jgi:hypothetical protein